MRSALLQLRLSIRRSAVGKCANKRLQAILALILFFGSSATIAAQTITGTVVDGGGEPLIGVNILVDGTSRGTVTDFDGAYSLNAASGDVLIFSYTGFTSERVTVGNETTIDITLNEDSEVLDEVVVIGYGVVRKSDLTGSVARIDGEEITGVVAGNPTSALQGKLSGV